MIYTCRNTDEWTERHDRQDVVLTCHDFRKAAWNNAKLDFLSVQTGNKYNSTKQCYSCLLPDRSIFKTFTIEAESLRTTIFKLDVRYHPNYVHTLFCFFLFIFMSSSYLKVL